MELYYIQTTLQEESMSTLSDSKCELQQLSSGVLNSQPAEPPSLAYRIARESGKLVMGEQQQLTPSLLLHCQISSPRQLDRCWLGLAPRRGIGFYSYAADQVQCSHARPAHPMPLHQALAAPAPCSKSGPQAGSDPWVDSTGKTHEMEKTI